MQSFPSAKDLSQRKQLVTIANIFKYFYSNLALDLVEIAKNIFGINSVKEYCSAPNHMAQ